MQYSGKAHVVGANIDTDAIIPARFLVTTDEAELGRNCMAGVVGERVLGGGPGGVFFGGGGIGVGGGGGGECGGDDRRGWVCV